MVGSRAAALVRLELLLDRCPEKRRIARLVHGGLTNREIAVQLGKSEHTVHTLLQHVFHKADIRNRVALAVMMSELLLLQP